MDYRDLTGSQLDALREIGNIGAGNAATALSKLLNKKIDMTIPSINIKKFEEVTSRKNVENEVEGVLVKAMGEISGSILVVFERDIALDFIETLTGISDNQIGELGTSVLTEIGNIISGAYMNSISTLTHVPMNLSVPGIASDMLITILTSTFIEAAQYDEYILDIESTMFLGEKSKEIGVCFYFVPNPGSMEKLLNSIGLI